MCAGGSCIQAVNLQVSLYAKNLGTPWVAPQLSIKNTGTMALPLSGLSLRYWYNEEATDGTSVLATCNTPTADVQTAFCDSTSMAGGCASTTGAPNFSWAFVNAGKTNADCYFAVTFSSSAGSLAAGASIADIELRWSKNDFSAMVNSNDYSYNGATAYTVTTKVTAYINSTTTPVLVYGTEPN
jgi:hypothetical protein